MNPRYLRYCEVHGKTPEEMSAHDDEAWPGGKMCGFMLWISAAWQAFDKHHSIDGSSNDREMRRWRKFKPLDHHQVFTEWLKASFCAVVDANGYVTPT